MNEKLFSKDFTLVAVGQIISLLAMLPLGSPCLYIC